MNTAVCIFQARMQVKWHREIQWNSKFHHWIKCFDPIWVYIRILTTYLVIFKSASQDFQRSQGSLLWFFFSFSGYIWWYLKDVELNIWNLHATRAWHFYKAVFSILWHLSCKRRPACSKTKFVYRKWGQHTVNQGQFIWSQGHFLCGFGWWTPRISGSSHIHYWIPVLVVWIASNKKKKFAKVMEWIEM